MGHINYNRTYIERFGCNIAIMRSHFLMRILSFIKCITFFLLFLLTSNSAVIAQNPGIEIKNFFVDDKLIGVTLVSDFKKLIREKLKKDFAGNYQPATITLIFPDSAKLTEKIEIRSRGKFRREKCNMPPVMLNFKTSNTVTLSKLGTLKLVWPCGTAPYDEQLVLKEYLIYKIYNLLTEKSFRVRLVKIGYRDINERMKPYTSYAYIMEDMHALARRNNCVEIQPGRIRSEQTNRDQTTLMTLFEYMIGNADWVIPISRNVKLIRSKTDSLSAPYAVPYDFDYSGLVNARYAIPPPELPIASVRERFYLGFPRKMEELQATLNIFRRQRASLDSLILNFEPLEAFNKKDMIKYISDFFEMTEKEKDIKERFINNARRE